MVVQSFPANMQLDQYLRVLVDDQVQFLRKTGDSGGGGDHMKLVS